MLENIKKYEFMKYSTQIMPWEVAEALFSKKTQNNVQQTTFSVSKSCN